MLATEAGIVAKNLTKPRQIQPNTEKKKKSSISLHSVDLSAIFSFLPLSSELSEAKLPTVLEGWEILRNLLL